MGILHEADYLLNQIIKFQLEFGSEFNIRMRIDTSLLNRSGYDAAPFKSPEWLWRVSAVSGWIVIAGITTTICRDAIYMVYARWSETANITNFYCWRWKVWYCHIFLFILA